MHHWVDKNFERSRREMALRRRRRHPLRHRLSHSQNLVAAVQMPSRALEMHDAHGYKDFLTLMMMLVAPLIIRVCESLEDSLLRVATIASRRMMTQEEEED